MAILGNIRKRSGLAVIFVGVAIFAFVLGDIGKSTLRNDVNVGEVAGETITYKDFEKKVEENVVFAKQSAKKDNLSSEEIFSVRQNTWTQVLNELIMAKQYEELGLSISEDEMTDLVQGNNPHRFIVQNFTDPQTGTFNRETLLNFLQTLDQREPDVKAQVENLFKYIKDDRLQQKYNSLVSKAYYMPKALLQKDDQLKNVKVTFRAVAQNFNMISDSLAKITDKDYEAYYAKNKPAFEQSESRDIDYVVFDVLPSTEDRSRLLKEMGELYTEFGSANDVPSFVNFSSDDRYDSSFKKKGSLPISLDSIMFNSPIGTVTGPVVENEMIYIARLMDIQTRPDSLKASHILISYDGAFNAESKLTKDQAKKIADSIYTALRGDKKKFEDLAAKYSKDPSVGTNKGDLGWFADGNMVYPFNKAVLLANTGDITRAESQFGFHIINVTGKTKAIQKIRVAIVNRAITPSTKTLQSVYSIASTFAGSNRTIESFNKAVVDQGLNKRTKEYMGPLDQGLPGMETSRELVRWAYNPEAKVGDISDAKEFENKFVVAALTKIRTKGIPKLEEIKSTIEAAVKKEKKLDLIAEKITALKASNLSELAHSLNARVDTLRDITFYSYNLPGFGREPNAIGSVFALNRNEISKPLKGTNYVFVVQVDNFSDAPAKSDYSMERMQMENNFQARATSTLSRALEKLANVEDNRVSFY
ncbi:MAG: peptidylprolyl isomerase [Bacteroidales bacterium]|nr:peptidylprolyl isomerase [Bacteroidales bacterium]